MNMTPIQVTPSLVEESRFVEVLTSHATGDLMGYRIGGSRPGPNAVLAACETLTEALFERFMALPTLPWMWGRLYLVSLDGVDNTCSCTLASCDLDVPIDGLVMLPYATKGNNGHADYVDSGYWTGLRLCRQLGMIEGRGVTFNSTSEKSQPPQLLT